MGPRGSSTPSWPGSATSGGVSRTPRTRRQPATAFCASLSTSVAICRGETNSVIRNRKAIRRPAVISPPMPSRTPSSTTPAMATDATISVSGNTVATIRCVRACAARLASIALSSRPAVRDSEPWARITAAPTTDSLTAASMSPVRSRTSV